MDCGSDSNVAGSSNTHQTKGDVVLDRFQPVFVLSARTVKRMKRLETLIMKGAIIHQCIDCGYQTGNKYCLVQHSRTHAAEKPFSCDLCHKKFSWHTSLVQHDRLPLVIL